MEIDINNKYINWHNIEDIETTVQQFQSELTNTKQKPLNYTHVVVGLTDVNREGNVLDSIS